MFNKTIPRGGDGAGRGGSKKCKPIPAPPCGVGLKSHSIPAPPSLRGGENPHGAKRGGAGQAGRGKVAIPTSIPKRYGFIHLVYDALFSHKVRPHK